MQRAAVSFLGARARGSFWSLRDSPAWAVACGLIALLAAGALAWWLWPSRAPEGSAKTPEQLLEEERALTEQLLAVRESRRHLEDEAYDKAHPHEAVGDFRGLNQAIDRFVEGKVSSVVEKVRVALARKEKAQRVLVHRYEVESKRTMDCLKASAQGLVDDVKGLADLADLHINVGEDDLAPVSMVFAGLVAPVQLYALVLTNRLFLAFHLVLVAFDATVLLMSHAAWEDWDPRCPGASGAVVTLYHQLVWLGLHCALHLAMLGVRCWAEWTLRVTYARIAERKMPPSMAWAGSLGVLLQSDLDNPRALYLFDTITGSLVFQASSYLLIADFALNIVGVLTFFTERARCSAGFPIHAAMQTYGVLFALFFLANVAALGIFIAYKLTLRPARLAHLLRSARQFDAAYMPAGLPVLSMALRAFVFRDISDRSRVEAQCLVQESRAVEEEEEALLRRVEQLRREREALAAARQKLSPAAAEPAASEEQFAEKWLHSLEETFAKGSGSEQRLSALLQSVRSDVEAAVQHAAESDAAHAARDQAKAAFEQAQAKAREAVDSPAGQAAVAQAKAAYEAAAEQAEAAVRSEAAQQALAKARTTYERAQDRARGVVESEAAQAAVAQAQEAYDEAQRQAQTAASAVQKAAPKEP